MRVNKDRLRLTILGTVWVSVVLAVYIWLGVQIRAEDAAYFFYSLGLVIAAGFSSVPFFIYHFAKVKEEKEEKK
jgi:hypothetical protein